MTEDLRLVLNSKRYVNMPDPDQVLRLIRSVGFYQLAGYDGCDCGHISLTNITVYVHCHRSGCGSPQCGRGHRGIHVFSASMDGPLDDQLRPIAEEVLEQICSDYDDEQKAIARERTKFVIGGNQEIMYSS